MNADHARHEIISEDLQIVRATLATLLNDVRPVSPRAAEALRNAANEVEEARQDILLTALR
jgi:hypothetical protein